MKHIQYFFIIFVLFVCAGMAQQKNSATVKFLIGDVQKLPTGQTSWVKLKINAKVFKGDRIKTGTSSRAEIEMPDGSTIRVDQGSIFDIKDIKTEEDDGEEIGDKSVAFSDQIQVSVSKLDNLLTLVGELMIEKDALIATSVLPNPTSPQTSLSIGCGTSMSSFTCWVAFA